MVTSPTSISPSASPIFLFVDDLLAMRPLIQLYADFHWQERYNTHEVPRSYNFARLESLSLICMRAFDSSISRDVGYYIFSIHPTHNPGTTTIYLELAYTIPSYRRRGILSRAVDAIALTLPSPWEIIVGLAPGYLPPKSFSHYETLYRKTSWDTPPTSF